MIYAESKKMTELEKTMSRLRVLVVKEIKVQHIQNETRRGEEMHAANVAMSSSRTSMAQDRRVRRLKARLKNK